MNYYFDSCINCGRDLSHKPTGNCFEANMKKILEIAEIEISNLFLCQGKTIKSDGNYTVHCWIEYYDLLLDFSDNRQIVLPRHLIYKNKRILEESIVRYTPSQAKELLYSTKEYRPYDETLFKFHKEEMEAINEQK